MAKKNFKNNPALQFISIDNEESKQEIKSDSTEEISKSVKNNPSAKEPNPEEIKKVELELMQAAITKRANLLKNDFAESKKSYIPDKNTAAETSKANLTPNSGRELTENAKETSLEQSGKTLKIEESGTIPQQTENNPLSAGWDYRDMNNQLSLIKELAKQLGIDLPKPPPYPVKPNPTYIETKSKRVQLLLQPTLYNQIKKIAELRENSVNDLIHRVLEDFIITNCDISKN